MKERGALDRASSRPGDIATVRRVYREIGRWRWWTLVVLGLDLLAIPLSLLSPVPLALAVDTAVNGDDVPAALAWLVPGGQDASAQTVLAVAAILTVVFVVLSQLRSLGATYVRTLIQEKATLSLRGRMLAHAQELSFRFHDERGTADAIYRIQYDAPAVAGIAVDGVFPFITSTGMLAAMLIVIVRIDPALAAIALAVAPILFLLSYDYRRRMKSRYRTVKRLESASLNVVHEVFAALRVVKAFGREDEESERYRDKSGDAVRATVSTTGAEELYSLLINSVTALGTALVLYVGLQGVLTGRLSLGAVLLVLGYLSQLYSPLQSLSRQVGRLQNRLTSAQRTFELLDEIPDVQDADDALPLDHCAGEFDLCDVHFSYGPDREVLQGIDLHVPPGSRVGIVGRTGAGKSTLVGLLIRFYDPTSGTIQLDGVDLGRYRLRDLRRQFAMVLQDPFLFSVSIRDNIAYARPGATDDEIARAARAAGMDEFIDSLPDGYDTMVGERGMTLSGGERQRLSLARAFLKDAPILLLDEPTSSVDTETESKIMEAMDRLMDGRTTFMIAHRVSTLNSCDFVVQVEDGRVRTCGALQRSTPGSRARRIEMSHRGGDHVDRTRVDVTTRDELTRAWMALGYDSIGPEIIKRLSVKRKKKRGDGIYRLTFAHAAGTGVIAKSIPPDRARFEERIMNDLLPRMGCAALLAYGTVPRSSSDEVWHFVEDAGEHHFSFDQSDHRDCLARWLGTLHGCADLRAEWLPARGVDQLRENLDLAVANIRQALQNVVLDGPARRTLDRTLDALCRVTKDWVEVSEVLDAQPQVLVHNDIKDENLGMVGPPGRRWLAAFDWEIAGLGPPSHDLGWMSSHFDEQLAEEYAAGWSASGSCAPTTSELSRWVTLGVLCRQLQSIYWDSRSLRFLADRHLRSYAERTLRHLDVYQPLLEAAHDRLVGRSAGYLDDEYGGAAHGFARRY